MQGARQNILVTGASGRIGAALVPFLVGAGHRVTALDRVAPADRDAAVRHVRGDITDAALIADLAPGHDALIHLAAHPGALEWSEIMAPNIVGAATVIEGAAAAGVARLIVASSIHVAGYTPLDARFDAQLPIRPDSPYGVSKVFAEATLRYAHERHGCAGYALRIGTCREQALTTRELTTWLSPQDFGRLVAACLSHSGGGYHMLWGFSDNAGLDIDRTAWDSVGYVPRDDAARFREGMTDIDAGTAGAGRIGGRFVRIDR